MLSLCDLGVSELCDVDTDFIPILWRKKLRLREVDFTRPSSHCWEVAELGSKLSASGFLSSSPPRLLYLHFIVKTLLFHFIEAMLC